MQQNLLQEALATLSTVERREFDKFVRSPFFNTRQQVVDWWERLSTHTPLSGGGVEERLLNSALLALLERYWAYQEKFQDSERAKIRLAAAYRKRGLTKHFKIILREVRHSREQQPWRHAEYYHDLQLIEWEQYQQEVAERRTEQLNLQASSDALDVAFVARKLRMACLTRSHQAVFKTEYRLGLLEGVLKYVQTNDLLYTPAIGLYFHCYHFLDGAADESHHFEQFRLLLMAHADLFPMDELRLLFLLAINYGIKQINRSAEGWLLATLDLYKGALARELLLENGVFSRFAFSNIVAIALRAGDTIWAAHFIEEHKKYLERQWRDATASLCMARVAYAQRDYVTALRQLQRSDYKDTLNNLAAKTLQMKIFYETTEYDLLESHLKNLKNYIRRHTAIGYHRTNYSRLVHYTEKLIVLNINDKKALFSLREQIAREPILTEKEWLLEQVYLLE